MEYSESVLDLIGNTPLVRLSHVTKGIVPEPGPLVLAKVEYVNPGGSVKDRIALRMVEAAEDAGLLKPGGTISGTGRFLKEASNGRVKVIGADPVGSVYSGGTGRPYLVEGVGEDFWPTAFDQTICDEIIAVSDKESFEMTRRLALEEGLLVGGSCGMAAAAALRVAATAGPDDVVVVLLPDSGRGYLSKVFNDEWLSRYGFVQSGDAITVGDVLRGKDGALPPFVHTHPTETVRDAIDILREYGVSQMPVVRAEPPVMAAEVVGSVVERDLMDALFVGGAQLADKVDAHMSAALPMVGAGEPVQVAVNALQSADAVVVVDDGRPVGVVTRQDVLGHLAL